MSRSMAVAALAALMVLGGVSAQTTSNCTRADIVSAIGANAELSTALTVISALNASYLLPNQAGNGTVFLPSNGAFTAALTALNTTAEELLATYPGQVLSVLAYHSLLNQGETSNRQALVDASPVATDLAIATGNASYTLEVTPSPGRLLGKEIVTGLAPNNTGLVRGIVKTCGYYVYQIDVVLLPAATVQEIPDALELFGGTVPANIDSLTPGGLAAAIADGTITPSGAGGAADGPSGAAGPSGSGSGNAGAPGADGSGAAGADGSPASGPGADGPASGAGGAPAPAPQSAASLSAGATVAFAMLSVSAVLLA